ncbi:MAG TPA: hypothetical protein VJ802_08860, partial [Gemmatimonadaceae bacterium]|nr:hypothetical protein [Gemmatimonadaceae bacterium]
MHASRLAAGALAASTSILLVAYVVEGRETGRDRDPAPSVRAPAASNWLTNLWTVEFDIEDIAEVRVERARFRRETRFQGMRYGVGLFPDLYVSSTGLTGRYSTLMLTPELEQDWKSSGRPKLPTSFDDETRRELLVGRHAKLCHDSLSVQTAGSHNSTGAPDTFVLSGALLWPANWVETIKTNPPARVADALQETQPLFTALDAEVPYDYAKRVNQGTVDLPLWNGAQGSVVALPLYNAGRTPISAGDFRKIKRSITYRITRKPMELVFMKQCGPNESPPRCVRDLVRTPYLACNDCDPVSDNYATDGSIHFVHPNVEIRLNIDGEDVTRFKTSTPSGSLQYFDVARRRRAWSTMLDVNDRPTGPIAEETTGPNGWVDDFTGAVGTGRMNEPNWYDMPSPFLVPPPARWPRQRIVQEFLVGVKRVPEFGFLHYFVAVDTKPGHYRVRKSRAEKITERDWCRIEATPRSLSDMPLSALDDTGWQSVP